MLAAAKNLENINQLKLIVYSAKQKSLWYFLSDNTKIHFLYQHTRCPLRKNNFNLCQRIFIFRLSYAR